MKTIIELREENERLRLELENSNLRSKLPLPETSILRLYANQIEDIVFNTIDVGSFFFGKITITKEGFIALTETINAMRNWRPNE